MLLMIDNYDSFTYSASASVTRRLAKPLAAASCTHAS